MNRRSFLSVLLCGFSSAAPGMVAASQAASPEIAQAVSKETAKGLDAADVEFSQRPQLHYNRQPQHRRPTRRRRRLRRR